MEDKIFFAPSNKFSIRMSEFVSFRKVLGLSALMELHIVTKGQQIGHVESASEHGGLIRHGKSSSSANYGELIVTYYYGESIDEDIKALKGFMIDDQH